MKRTRTPMRREVFDEIERRLQMHPDYPDLHNQLGLLEVTDGDPEEAERHFGRALQINPNYREAFLNLGCLYVKAGRLREAEELLRSKRQKYRQDGFYQNLAGILFFLIGQAEKGISQIKSAIGLQPFYQRYYRRLGVLRKGILNLPPKSAVLLSRVPSDHLRASYHDFLGLHLAEKGRFGYAEKELRKAARLEPGASLFHMHLGVLRYLRGHHREAIRELRRGLKIYPFWGMGHAHLSYAYGAMGHTGRALRSMERAVELNPQYADLHYNLALLYGGQKRYEEAISELRTALRINPNYLFARINLGVVYEELNRRKDARREYQKVLQMTPEDEHVRRRLERIS